jgi:hypothetical protein
MDSNARSKMWRDNETNSRSKTLEEIVTSRNLHIMNVERERTTFQGRRGSSNIAITVINIRLLQNFHDWEISEDESCCDRNIIKFKLGHETKQVTQRNHHGLRYTVQGKSYNRFDQNLREIVANKFQMENTEDIAILDSNLATHTEETSDMESVSWYESNETPT